MSKHRADVSPRWGRIGLTAAAAAVVVVALAAGAGAFSHRDDSTMVADTTPAAVPTRPPASPVSPVSPASPVPSQVESPSSAPTGSAAAAVGVPPDSGTGRRAVFSQSEQRVWIVDADGTVERTYLVSGSVEDNLQPGTYSVYSRSRHAYGVQDSGRMQYFVRFARGSDTGAAIGFHSIPVKDGSPVETVAQLGTPLSHGCIRQKMSDAIAMWNFAHDGTKVVVVV